MFYSFEVKNQKKFYINSNEFGIAPDSFFSLFYLCKKRENF